MNESAIEKKAVSYAQSLGCLVFKFTSPNQRSVPDRQFISGGGDFLLLEFKRNGAKPTELQMRMLKRLRRQNVQCGWVDDWSTARLMINTWLKEPGEFNTYFAL